MQHYKKYYRIPIFDRQILAIMRSKVVKKRRHGTLNAPRFDLLTMKAVEYMSMH